MMQDLGVSLPVDVESHRQLVSSYEKLAVLERELKQELTRPGPANTERIYQLTDQMRAASNVAAASPIIDVAALQKLQAELRGGSPTRPSTFPSDPTP